MSYIEYELMKIEDWTISIFNTDLMKFLLYLLKFNNEHFCTEFKNAYLIKDCLNCFW